MASKQKYKKGDIVGVCGDAMYEFEINSYSAKHKAYIGKCLKSYTKTIKVGDVNLILPSQIVVKLGEKGKKFDV